MWTEALNNFIVGQGPHNFAQCKHARVAARYNPYNPYRDMAIPMRWAGMEIPPPAECLHRNAPPGPYAANL